MFFCSFFVCGSGLLSPAIGAVAPPGASGLGKSASQVESSPGPLWLAPADGPPRRLYTWAVLSGARLCSFLGRFSCESCRSASAAGGYLGALVFGGLLALTDRRAVSE